MADELVMTTSAKRDYIRDFLKSNKEYADIVHSFIAKPFGSFLFNPMEDENIVNIFLDEIEDFPGLVKAAIINYLSEFTQKTSVIESLKKNLQVIITDARHIKMNEWDSKYESMPIATECQVIGANKEETYTKSARAVCYTCGNMEDIQVLSNLPLCKNKECDAYRMKMTLDSASIKTGDIRVIMIQEPLEEAKHGSPRILECQIKDGLVHNTFIGQRKKLIGVFRSLPQHNRTNNRIMINTISMHDLDEIEVKQPSFEQIREFEALINKPNFIDIITESLAPEIKHERLAKLCVLLSIIGGNRAGRLRGNIHCLLIGDPSTGKSTILQYIPMIIQKTGFAVGGTMSGSGVTVTMDTLPNRQRMPRAGIVPLCSGSCVAIDELNQLPEEDLGKLYQAMEQGKINYNKGGFDLTLEAYTTILAGSNPRDYDYNPNESIMYNINLPPPLISRFDLKVNMLKKKSDIEEQQILDHIIKIRQVGIEEYIKKNGLLAAKDMTLFLNYVKTFKPIMNDESANLLKQFHLTMLKTTSKQGGLSVDKRFFESMYRMSTAYAKLNLSKEITKEHAISVIEIFRKTLETFGMVTEGEKKQEDLKQSITTKDVAFIKAMGNLKTSDDPTFTEKEGIKAMMKYAPKYFPDEIIARKEFNRFYINGILERKGERYKIV